MRELHEDEIAASGRQALHAPDDLRTAQRFAVNGCTGKLVTDLGEFVCSLADVSDNGVAVRIYHPLPHSGPMVLELANGDRQAVELVWQKERRAGFRLLGETSILDSAISSGRFGERPVRIALDLPALVEGQAETVACRILDFSQTGAKIECTHRLVSEQRVSLKAPGLAFVKAKVCWRSSGIYGLAFDGAIELSLFAQIVAKMQLLHSQRRMEAVATAA